MNVSRERLPGSMTCQADLACWNQSQLNNLNTFTLDSANIARGVVFGVGVPVPSPQSTFNNFGTFATGTAACNIQVDFNNSGTLTATCALSLLADGTHSGTFDVGGGASLTFTKWNRSPANLTTNTFQQGSKMDGAGAYNIDNTAKVVIDAAANIVVTNLNLKTSGAMLDGVLTVNGNLRTRNMDWSGGTLAGTGVLEVAANDLLTIEGNAQKTLNSVAIFDQGTIQWTGGDIKTLNNPRITVIGPTGTFNILTGSKLLKDPNVPQGQPFGMIFVVGGTVQEQGNHPPADIQIPISNWWGTVNLYGNVIAGGDVGNDTLADLFSADELAELQTLASV